MNIRIVVALSTAVAIAGCAGMQDGEEAMLTDDKMMAPKDGDLAMPAGYETWPVFVMNIDKEKNKQVRDIYINTRGTSMQKGDMFPDGTQFVMTLYNAQQHADGSLMMMGDDKLVKGGLSKVFIMEKRAGWGDNAPAGLKNGDWIYAAYNADGSRAEADYNACRDCHMSLSDTDFVFHYDKYFSN
jgi:hemoglobin